MQDALVYRDEIPNLEPLAEHAIEWWFVQGRISGPRLGARHVMTALFRVHALDGSAPHGAMLLQHMVEETTGRAWTHSRITPQTISHHRDIARRVACGSLPALTRGFALKRHLVEAAQWAHRSGIVVDDAGPRFRERPFAVTWNGFELSQSSGGLDMRIALGPDQSARLSLRPETFWLDERSERLHADFGPAFGYQCCPRLSATGMAGDEPVEGTFWLDRQWGRYEGLLLTPVPGGFRLLGWHWFGLNLDNGTDLIVYQQRDAARARNGTAAAVAFKDGYPRLRHAVHAEPSRYWTSPRSGARYPVGWTLTLPEEGLSGEVQPLLDDQEIPVYGTTAIWEGAARFDGTTPQGHVTGKGRLELVGYGTPLTIGAQAGRSLRQFGKSVTAGIGRWRAG